MLLPWKQIFHHIIMERKKNSKNYADQFKVWFKVNASEKLQVGVSSIPTSMLNSEFMNSSPWGCITIKNEVDENGAQNGMVREMVWCQNDKAPK